MSNVATRQRGEVKWFDDQKGYGFITPDVGRSDVFVHYSAIEGTERRKTLEKGQRVSFLVEASERNGKPQAIAVEKDS
jgi:cold shock protein